MKITINTLASRLMDLEVDDQTTTEELKASIEVGMCIPSSCQRLYLDGQPLDNWRRLCDYSVADNATINLCVRVGGGGQPYQHFLFTNATSPFQRRPAANNKDAHRQHCNGVSSEGRCVNPGCRVYGKTFLCRHGYGVYLVGDDPTVCPECFTRSPRVESFGFSRANVQVRAMEVGLKGQKPIVRGGLSESKGNYCYLPYFDLVSPQNKEYEFIEVYSCAPESTVNLNRFKFCSVCYRVLQGRCDHGTYEPF